MIYFSSRHISQALGINLARWKRWVREFLPPDPLSGRQSGYARNFNIKDVFQVYLAGYLVGTMNFGVAQARQIVSDLEPSLKARGYQTLHADDAPDTQQVFWVMISRSPDGGFDYIESPLNTTESDRNHALEQLFDALAGSRFVDARVLSISALYRRFIHNIQRSRPTTRHPSGDLGRR